MSESSFYAWRRELAAREQESGPATAPTVRPYPASATELSKTTGTQNSVPCHDCGILKGELHVTNCDVEECPVCGGQFISCDCPFEEREQ